LTKGYSLVAVEVVVAVGKVVDGIPRLVVDVAQI
jgi:hypothetical protein